MCLVLLGYRSHPQYPLILAANRDEFFNRPTLPAAFWDDAPLLFAGRDGRRGGTWLGITTSGRWGTLTNFHDPSSFRSDVPSRGDLVREYLVSHDEPHHFLQTVEARGNGYNGFNLLIGDGEKTLCYSNRDQGIRELVSGIYGLSNHLLDTPWPKVARAREEFTSILTQERLASETLFNLLADRTSAIFVVTPTYGTRSSAVLLVTEDRHAIFCERTFGEGGKLLQEIKHEFIVG